VIASPPIDWSALRGDFPVLAQDVHGKPLVYFDNAATSQKPRQVIDAISRYYERDNSNVHRGIHELSNAADDERNPPHTGVMDREMKRVKNGRLFLIPASENTAGHGTTGQARWWKDELAKLLQSAPRRGQ
jgi:hypothetical protein